MKDQGRKKSFLVNFKNRENNKGKRNNPVHFLFFDTETKQREEMKLIGKKEYRTVINTLDFGFACYWNKETDHTEWCHFTTIKEFHKFLGHCVKSAQDNTLWIIAHNIVFDNFIVDIWEYFKKYDVDFIHAKGMVYLQSLTKRQGKKVRQKIMLINNGNIFPATLKTIGKTTGLEKLEIDFENMEGVSRETFEAYGKRDVEILLEFWKQWTSFIETNKLGNVKYTISSQSMESFRKRFCDHYVVLDDDLENLAFERKAYYGGRTEIFFKGQVKKGIYYYDVNSMYPHCMKDYQYPTEFKFTKDQPAVDQVMWYIKKGWMVVAEVNINTKSNNCYPVKVDNTLMFPVGAFKTYLCTPEVITAYEQGDLVSFGHVSFYKGEQIFSEYVDFFYNKRLELKRQGNKQETMYKLFLNSLYGKFGQMMDSWKPTTVEEIRELDPNFNFDLWIMDQYKIPKIIIGGIDITPSIRWIGGQLQMSCEKTESNISFPAIAGHVTSYSRLIIWKALKWAKEKKVKVYYCDTDSLFIDQPLPADLVDPSKLGMFKLEKYFDYGVEFMNLKNYCELTPEGKKIVETETGETIMLDDETFLKDLKIKKGSHWKMKGVSNSATMIDENTFIMQEWGSLPKQEYYTRFGRNKGEFWVIYKEKTNHGTIRKGNLQDTGDIDPFEYGLKGWEGK